MLTEITLPETNSSHLKMGGWKTSFLLECPIFRGYVSFREGNVDWFYSESSVVRLCDWIHPEKVLDLAGDKKSGFQFWVLASVPQFYSGICLFHPTFFEENGRLFRTKLNLHSSLLVHLASHISHLFITVSYLFVHLFFQIPRKLTTTLGTLML